MVGNKENKVETVRRLGSGPNGIKQEAGGGGWHFKGRARAYQTQVRIGTRETGELGESAVLRPRQLHQTQAFRRWV